MRRLIGYWSERSYGSKIGLVLFAICIIVGIAFLGDHIFHTQVAHLSLVLPFIFSAYFFMSVKLINYKLVDNHIKIVAFGVFNLFDLPVENIISVESTPPLSMNFKKPVIYRLGNSLREAKVITMRDGRVFGVTPEPGSDVHSILSSKE